MTAQCPECPAVDDERHATACRTGRHPGAVEQMTAGYRPHAYAPDCGCPVCDGIRVTCDRAEVYRMACAELGHPDWTGRATTRLIPRRSA